MNKLKCLIFMLMLLLTSTSFAFDQRDPFAYPDELTGNVNVFLGQKQLDSSDWEPADKQDEVAIDFDFQQKRWPVAIVLGIRSSDGKGTIDGYYTHLNVETKQREISLGLRKIFHATNSNLHPYIGGGLSSFHTEASANGHVGYYYGSFTQSADSTGVWLGAGVYWTLNRSFNLGPEIRFSSGSAHLLNQDQQVGGTHVGLLLGYHY